MKTELNKIERPTGKLEAFAHTTAFYNPDRQVTIYKTQEGRVVSCELSHGWLEYWYEGDYREVTQNWPMSHSQYFEF